MGQANAIVAVTTGESGHVWLRLNPGSDAYVCVRCHDGTSTLDLHSPESTAALTCPGVPMSFEMYRRIHAESEPTQEGYRAWRHAATRLYTDPLIETVRKSTAIQFGGGGGGGGGGVGVVGGGGGGGISFAAANGVVDVMSIGGGGGGGGGWHMPGLKPLGPVTFELKFTDDALAMDGLADILDKIKSDMERDEANKMIAALEDPVGTHDIIIGAGGDAKKKDGE